MLSLSRLSLRSPQGLVSWDGTTCLKVVQGRPRSSNWFETCRISWQCDARVHRVHRVQTHSLPDLGGLDSFFEQMTMHLARDVWGMSAKEFNRNSSWNLEKNNAVLQMFSWPVCYSIQCSFQCSYPPTPADARGSAPGNNTFDSCFGLLPQPAQQQQQQEK